MRLWLRFVVTQAAAAFVWQANLAISAHLEGPRARGFQDEAAVEDRIGTGGQALCAYQAGGITVGKSLADSKQRFETTGQVPSSKP